MIYTDFYDPSKDTVVRYPVGGGGGGGSSGVNSFNGRSGSVLPIAGDYDDSKVILSSTMHISGEDQTTVKEALEALEARPSSTFNGRSGSILPMAGDYNDSQVVLSSVMHIGGGTQTNVKQAIDALTDDGGHTIKNNAGTILPQEINLKFDGRLTAVDENGQTVVKMNDVVTTPVSCLVGDEYVTITNSAIHTTSTIIMFWGKNQSTVTPVFYDSVEYAEGELTINFNEPLKVATSVYLQIINYPTSSGGAVSSNRTGVYGHTVIDNTGTALANRPYMKFDGRITAVDDSTNNQTVVKLKDVVTPSVSCLLGDEEVTIANSAIHTTSTISVFFEQDSPIYGVGYDLLEVSEGSITIYFVEPLPKATDVYLVILN